MNFLNPFNKFRIIFLLLLLSVQSVNSSVIPDISHKGTPLFQIFTGNLNFPYHENSCFVMDKTGILFIGQEDKIVIYNRQDFDFLNINNVDHLSINDDNVVFFSSGNNIGFLKPDNSLKFLPVNLNDKLPGKIKSFKNVHAIESAGKNTIFQIDSFLVLFGSEQFKIIAENFAGKIFSCGNRIATVTCAGVINTYSDNQLVEYKSQIQDIRLIIPANDGYFVIDRKNFLYTTDLSFDIKNIMHVKSKGEIIQAIELSKEELLIATSANEIIFLRPEIQNSMILNDPSELPNSRIIKILSDPYQNVWILQEKALCQLKNPSQIKNILTLNKDCGKVLDIKLYGDFIILATTKGLYSYDPEKSILNNYNNSGFFFRTIPLKKCFLAASARSVCLQTDEKLNTLFRGKVFDISYNSYINTAFVSAPDGIHTYHLQENKIAYDHLIKTEILPLRIISDSINLLYSDGQDLFRINLDPLSAWNSIKINTPAEKTISDLFIWKHKLCASINGEIYFLDGNSLLPDKIDINIADWGKIRFLKNDSEGNLMIVSETPGKKFLIMFGRKDSETFTPIALSLPALSLPPAFDLKGDSIMILSAGTEIFSVNLNSCLKTRRGPDLFVTGIFTQNDTIYEGILLDYFIDFLSPELQNLPFRKRHLKIHLNASPAYEEIFIPQYRLLGKNDNWHDMNSDLTIDLDNLREGNYQLQVRSFSNKTPSTILNFGINDPFYRNSLAYLFYIASGLIVLFVIFKSYRLKLHQSHTVKVASDEEPDQYFTSIPDNQTMINVKDESHGAFNVDKGKDSTRWDKYEMVTVLFSDIQGFTKIAESMNPEVLIDELDKFFFHFDSVVEKYNIEKIKTIGDAYMAAGGIPDKSISNPVEVVLAALEMQHYMKQLKNTKVDIWDLRIGIHSGPVIAGVVGHKKRSYDIWGDTVNTASRMESSGEPGKVNISGTTFNLVKDYFICEYRGKLPVKYKGNIDMYFVKGLRPELSVNLAGLPNRKFFLKLQSLRIRDLETTIYEKLESELPKNNYFHNVEFIKHQYHYSELLTKAEHLDEEDSILIITASLLMNIGFTEVYNSHENRSAEFARKILPKYRYSDRQITTVSNLILSSKWPPELQNSFEKILYDVKMEYLGRADFLKLYKLLFLEQSEHMIVSSVNEFKQQQIKIIEQFNFYTSTARRLREVSREEQIGRIINDDWN